ncbi:unnamed protein product [Prunus brigantina]
MPAPLERMLPLGLLPKLYHRLLELGPEPTWLHEPWAKRQRKREGQLQPLQMTMPFLSLSSSSSSSLCYVT